MLTAELPFRSPLILGLGLCGGEYQYEHNLHYLTQEEANHNRTL